MSIVKAVGLGIAILVLKTLVPTVFSQLESTSITFLRSAEIGAQTAGAAAASLHALDNERPLTLPQAPGIRRFK